MKNLLILVIFFLCVGMFFYLTNFSQAKIEFQKLRPIKGKINVYYNGYKIGFSKRITPCPHSKGVCVDVFLNKKSMFVPENITAKMKQKMVHQKKYEDYIELIYPKDPSSIELKDDAIITGVLAGGFHNYLNEEVEYSEMEQMKTALLNTADNLEKSTSILVDILSSLNNMASTSENNVEVASKNIAASMKNLNSITAKLDYSLNPEVIKNILMNFDETSDNLNGTTYNLKNFTGTIEGSSSDINSAVSSINSLTYNASEIARGVKCTLKKPFGGLRLLFGKVIR